MVTPDGKFYQNNDNSTYNYSDDILNLGIEKALNQVGFQYEKYEKRGGAYKLWIFNNLIYELFNIRHKI